MEMTAEMVAAMEKSMAQHYEAYWREHATPEQEAKRVAEGKTFEGAFGFAKSVAEKYRGKGGNGNDCVAMPDGVAYWLLMHYMAEEAEGAKYRTPEEVEAERRKAEEEERKRIADLEEKARKASEGSMIPVSPEEVAKAEEEAKAAKAKARESAKAAADEKKRAEAVKENVEQMALF